MCSSSIELRTVEGIFGGESPHSTGASMMISISGFVREVSGWNLGVLCVSLDNPGVGTVSGRGSKLPSGKFCCRHSSNLSFS